MSDSARPDLEALDELEQLIRSLADEMATWRHRAHDAEARLRTVDERTAQTAAGKPSPEMVALSRENEELKQRLEGAKLRTRQLLDRLRFLRQQHETEVKR
ncbi:MAG: hypothetical protein ACREOJ_05055 [Gemmatimonadaceae bacterium]